jgi:hypothetical protein
VGNSGDVREQEGENEPGDQVDAESVGEFVGVGICSSDTGSGNEYSRERHPEGTI